MSSSSFFKDLFNWHAALLLSVAILWKNCRKVKSPPQPCRRKFCAFWFKMMPSWSKVPRLALIEWGRWLAQLSGGQWDAPIGRLGKQAGPGRLEDVERELGRQYTCSCFIQSPVLEMAQACSSLLIAFDHLGEFVAPIFLSFFLSFFGTNNEEEIC